jgi:hypothetical protein
MAGDFVRINAHMFNPDQCCADKGSADQALCLPSGMLGFEENQEA